MDSLPPFLKHHNAHPYPNLSPLYTTTTDLALIIGEDTSTYSNATLTIHQKVPDPAVITMDGSVDNSSMLVVRINDTQYIEIPAMAISMHAVSDDGEGDAGRHVFLQCCDMSKDDYENSVEVKLGNLEGVEAAFDAITTAVESTPVEEGGGGMDANMMALMSAVQGGQRGFIGPGGGEGAQFEDADE